MPAKTRKVLDSFALLAFVRDEPAAEQVEALLRRARVEDRPLLINEINLGECYYILAKEDSVTIAEGFLRRVQTQPIQTVGNRLAEVLDAARIKARFPISYADAFVVATAQRANAAVITGDPEFRAVSHLVDIDWLPQAV